MNNIYFADDLHQQNYEKMKDRFPLALKDTEYQVACYIAAIPMIFYKFEEHLNDLDTPVSWIINWQSKYLPKDDDETDEEYQERINMAETVNYDLTESMQHLGKLALNLWNGYEYFNLMACLRSIDDENYMIVKCAMDIRMGLLKGQ